MSMKKFLTEITFIFFLPILCIAVVAEYSIRAIPNDYSYKNQWMENNCKNLNILCLGPSSVYYGINPKYFDKKSFNGAHVSESLNYDNFIFNKFIDQMDSLQYLVLDIDYWSPFSSLETGQEWWRATYYNIYYGCKKHRGEIKYNFEMAIHNFSTFKKAGQGFLNVIGFQNISNNNITKLGFGTNYSQKNKILDWNNGKNQALNHNNWIKEQEHFNLVNKNKTYLNEILKKCASKNIRVLMISTPTCNSYRENLNVNYLKRKNDFCNSFVASFNNVSYLDFSSDKSFIDEDFFDGSHLNEIGAKKFTGLINQKILGWQ